ncbi:hypothetical protein L195_g003342 [Trifolium pratense]|uniref:Uncharacterized protein n=1 Tax=Trifolium pratense TaxID=57577 RepID=A0A2K3NV15_TRIPR|nr:hypothetical protein L195_g003342 [Trifolium pratense]
MYQTQYICDTCIKSIHHRVSAMPITTTAMQHSRLQQLSAPLEAFWSAQAMLCYAITVAT